MIVVTGAAGFIGSCLISYLNKKGIHDIIVVDSITKTNHPNLTNKIFKSYIDRDLFIDWFLNHPDKVHFVFHIGARTDTTEKSEAIFEKLNVNYSKDIWNQCTKHNIPLIYASSAATYGGGTFGYSDDHQLISNLQALNPYGWSKQKFDVWALEQYSYPDKWAGFKFFNVFGPNEYHKGRMASVILHAYQQIKDTGKVKLFKSNDPDIQDGHQKRDFIYVFDLLDVLYYFYEHSVQNGIYNLGSGNANTFLSLVNHVFSSLNQNPQIEFFEMPLDLIQSYQNYTCANMSKLKSVGYHKQQSTFESAVHDYVTNYLVENKYY